MAKKSDEFIAFDKAMTRVLTVSKTELDARVKGHKPSGKKRGPKPKTDAPVSAR